jgi:c-di-GMP-binding flagellar brake protein YcgR
MKERRKVHRKPLHYFTHVYDRKTRQLIGYLVDISLEGGLLVTEKEIPLETLIYLQIDLPDALVKVNLDITSRVVWCETDPDSDLYKTGVEWVSLDPEVQDLFRQMIS